MRSITADLAATVAARPATKKLLKSMVVNTELG
jgi:hypothetical protein